MSIREPYLSANPFPFFAQAPTHSRHAASASVLRRTTASADGYDLLFSLLVPQPESVLVHWDIAGAIDGYFQPFLDALGNFSTFSVKSQGRGLTVGGILILKQAKYFLAIFFL